MSFKKLFSSLPVPLVLITIFALITNCDIFLDKDVSQNVSVSQTPEITDFDIDGTGIFDYDGQPKVVYVSAREDKTGGIITVKYNDSTIAPAEAGDYEVTFDVAEAPGWNEANELSAGTLTIVCSYFISASQLMSFGSLQTPYSQPAGQTVTVSNTGTGAVTLVQPEADNYIIGTLSKTCLASAGDEATFTVQPKAGLKAGSYNETITISGTSGASATVYLMFTVTAQSNENRDKVVTTLKTAQKASPTNIVFLGDGFTWDDNSSGGFFDAKVAELSNFIFSIKPYSTYKDYFSVYSVSAVSASRGAKSKPTDSAPNTIFNSTYGYMGIDRLLVTRNNSLVREYARLATPNPHIIVVIVNDSKYGGSGGEYAVTSVNSSAKEIVIHEVGHIFSLADEYVDEQYRQAAGITINQAKLQPNVDTTNNLSQIKWSHFIGLPGYNDSAWEGGYYFATGVWRPAQNSIMRNYTLMEYNAISRETIVKKIISNAKEQYSLADFLKRDSTAGPNIIAAESYLAGSDNPMPVPVEFYTKSLYGDQKIRARFIDDDN